MAQNASNQYDGMSLQELAGQFAGNRYFSLSGSGKRDLLQAVVAEKCRQDGIKDIPVELSPMGGSVGGHYDGSKIVLNSHLVCDQSFRHTYSDHSYTETLDDANYRTLEAVLHEYRHAFQDAVVNGAVQGAEEQKHVFSANQFTASPVLGSSHRGCQYITRTEASVYSDQLYFLNPTELDAFKSSQEEIKTLLAQNPNDLTKLTYLDNLAERGWEARLNNAQNMMGRYSDNVEKDMETVLCNAYYGTNEPVNEQFEMVVQNAMVMTQYDLDQKCDVLQDLEAFDQVQAMITENSATEEDIVVDLSDFDLAQAQTEPQIQTEADISHGDGYGDLSASINALSADSGISNDGGGQYVFS